MTHDTTTTAAPILGEKARLALQVDAGGRKRRKLLVLLAAYADAGISDPPMRELMGRTGIDDVRQVDQLLRMLAKQGLIHVDWAHGRPQRNTYELLFAGELNGAGETDR